MGRIERPVDPTAGPVARFAHDLRLLRRAAGNPPYKALARRAHYSVTALSQAAAGHELPALKLTIAYVRACGGDVGSWVDRWHQVDAELQSQTDRTAIVDVQITAPYRGLAPFHTEDAPWFFGREKLVAELLDRLRHNRLLAVFGPSGSGKSSVVRAGLVPAARSEFSGPGGEMPVVILVPGENPLHELSRRLREFVPGTVDDGSNVEPDARKVLNASIAKVPDETLMVVDQFEELYTLGAVVDERMAFVDALLRLATDPNRRVRVVLCVRAEFYAGCAEHAGLATALTDRQRLVGPMSAEELRSAIIGPALKAGLTVDAGLVGRAIADAVSGGGAGTLPLLSHALLQTWRRRSGTVLTLADYLATGGLSGAIARTADQMYDSCEPAQQPRVKQIFIRLTTDGPGADHMRRRMRRSDLLAATGAAPNVLDRLVGARLLTTDEYGVEIAHETLIREWPALREWLDEDRDGLRLHRGLTAATADWVALGRDQSALWRGARLNAAREWAEADNRALTAEEQIFLQVSVERERGELAASRRSNRRLRRLAGVLAAAVVLVVATGLVAVQQRQMAQHERDVSTAERLGVQARALVDQQPLSLLLAMESLRRAPNDNADAALLTGLLDPRHNSLELVGHDSTVYAIAFGPDPNTVFTAGEGRTIYQWDTRTGAPLAPPWTEKHTDPVTSLAVSPDGATVVSASDDSTVLRWDVSTGTPIEPALTGHEDHVKAVAMSRDGRLIVTASLDGTVRRWDARTGLQLGEPMRGHSGEVWAVALSPDGSAVASGGDGGVVRTWDAATGTPLAESTGGSGVRVKALAISATGVVLVGSEEGPVRRLTRSELVPIGPPLIGHTSGVRGVTTTSDGRTAITVGSDGTVRRWNIADGTPLEPALTGHSDQVNAVAVSADGVLIGTASRDRTARLWGAERPKPIGPTVPHADQVARMNISKDHTQLAWSGKDGVLRRWDLARDVPLVASAGGHSREIRSIAYSADGSMIVTGGEDNAVIRWDADSGKPLGPAMIGHSEEIPRVAITPDGSVIASGSWDGTVRRWDGRTGAPLGEPLTADGGDVSSVVTSPDGSTIFAATYDLIWRWDARTGAVLGPPLQHEGRIEAIAVSGDGVALAAAGEDRRVRQWDVASGESVGEPLVGHDATVTRIAFTRNDQQIVTVDENGVVLRWDRASGARAGRPLTNYGDFDYRRALSSDGTLLGAATSSGELQVFPADPEQWREYACRIVGRNLTLPEWKAFVGPDVEYVRTCPQLPPGPGTPP